MGHLFQGWFKAILVQKESHYAPNNELDTYHKMAI